MENRLDVSVAVADANHAFRKRPFALCLPLLLLYVALWAFEQFCRWVLPSGAAVSLILGFCALVSFAELWTFVLVSKAALAGNGQETIGYLARSVAAIPHFRRLTARLYGRLMVWCFASFIVIVVAWFVVLVGVSIIHGMPQPHTSSHHTTHPLATWLTVMAWSLLLEVFFSRYLFILPMAAILQRGDASVFDFGVVLGSKYRSIAIAAALANWAFVTLPVCAFAHFTRHALQGVRFGNSAMELIVSVGSGVGATWFVLLKLWLTQQALAKTSSGTAAS